MAQKVTAELTHYSHIKGAEGGPGTVCQIDEDLAARWLKVGGCKLVEDEPGNSGDTPGNGNENNDSGLTTASTGGRSRRKGAARKDS